MRGQPPEFRPPRVVPTRGSLAMDEGKEERFVADHSFALQPGVGGSAARDVLSEPVEAVACPRRRCATQPAVGRDVAPGGWARATRDVTRQAQRSTGADRHGQDAGLQRSGSELVGCSVGDRQEDGCPLGEAQEASAPPRERTGLSGVGQRGQLSDPDTGPVQKLVVVGPVPGVQEPGPRSEARGLQPLAGQDPVQVGSLVEDELIAQAHGVLPQAPEREGRVDGAHPAAAALAEPRGKALFSAQPAAGRRGEAVGPQVDR